jgi:hypothetical protein
MIGREEARRSTKKEQANGNLFVVFLRLFVAEFRGAESDSTGVRRERGGEGNADRR